MLEVVKVLHHQYNLLPKDKQEKDTFFFLSTLDRATRRWEDIEYCVEAKGSVEDCMNSMNAFMVDCIENSPELELYWCPLPYSKPMRKKEYCIGSAWLWSDLDEADTGEIPKPHFLWKTSEGRHQALWKLPQFLPSMIVEPINRRMTILCEADISGWDLTQVLRVPGSLNNKYEPPERVHTIIDSINKKAFELPKTLFEGDKDREGLVDVPLPEDFPEPRIALKEIKRKCDSTLVRKLLQRDEPERGNRSEVLWKLVREMWESGIQPETQFVIIKNSVWNKFEGRTNADKTLWELITKAKVSGKSQDELKKDKQKKETSRIQREDFDEDDEQEARTLEVVSFESLMGSINLRPGWMIQHIWSKNSWGIVGGEPKSFKTMLAMEMAVSVAAGTPFLGRFQTHQQGPVLIVQNENSPWIMQDRLQKIMKARGLVGQVIHKPNSIEIRRWPKNLTIDFINQQGVMLDEPDDKELIEAHIQKIKPILVIFDPFYLMFSGDINNARELQPTLKWLLRIQKEYSCAIQLIHHKKKANKGVRGGQALLGSTILHGWSESGWSVSSEQTGADTFDIKVEREFRGAPNGLPLSLKLKMNTKEYSLDLDDDEKGDDERMTELVRGISEVLEGGKAFGLTSIRDLVSGSRSQLKACLNYMVEEGVAICSKNNDGQRVWTLKEGSPYNNREPKEKKEETENSDL